jgi:hypothetical protein
VSAARNAMFDADGHVITGMTLRDWFAGQALAGILANADTPWSPNVAEIDDIDVARAAYDMANAMLAARQSQAGSQ